MLTGDLGLTGISGLEGCLILRIPFSWHYSSFELGFFRRACCTLILWSFCFFLFPVSSSFLHLSVSCWQQQQCWIRMWECVQCFGWWLIHIKHILILLLISFSVPYTSQGYHYLWINTNVHKMSRKTLLITAEVQYQTNPVTAVSTSMGALQTGAANS